MNEQDTILLKHSHNNKKAERTQEHTSKTQITP